MATPTTTGQIRPASTHSSEPETRYSLPEQFPLPENGIDYFDILDCSLSRAEGIMNLITEDADTPMYIIHAAEAVCGLGSQAKRVVSNLHTTQEVQS